MEPQMTFTKKNIKIEEQILEDFMSLLDSGNLDKTWKKEYGYRKNNQNSFHVVAIDYGIKKKYFKIFFRF